MSDEHERQDIGPMQGKSQKKEPQRDRVIRMIESLIRKWNIDPGTIKDTERDRWYLIQGSATFHIELFTYDKGPPQGTVDCIEVCGIIMKQPQKNFPLLCKRLLELNSTAVGMYFALRNDLVLLLSTREIEGMGNAELAGMINELRYFSDFWDDKLKTEFGES